MSSGTIGSSIAIACVALAACNSPKRDDASGIGAIASGSLAVRAPVPAAPSVPPSPEKPIIERPKGPEDLIVSDEKRARVESLAPEAKGFLTSADLEQQLYRMQLRRGKDADAIKELEKLAKGKWVLFTGNIGNPTADSCELPIRYTPKDPNDFTGLTSTWLSIKVTNITGYGGTEYRQGELAVILAKYDGKLSASPGYDPVFLKHWFQ
jgi:hypothetical protein